MTQGELEERAYALLCRKYAQRADKRQKGMGLSYTEAETHDLARLMATFAAAAIAQRDAEKVQVAYPEGWGPMITS